MEILFPVLVLTSMPSAWSCTILEERRAAKEGAVMLLNLLIQMDQGLKVLRDIAEILNANFENYEPIDLEVGGSVPFAPYDATAKVVLPCDLESLSDFE
jgi:hypothetical protein